MPRLCHASILPVFLIAGLSIVPAKAEVYRLGPQDQLEVKVFDLRPGTGEAFQWNAFIGTFVIGADGHVSLPLVGNIDANGKTTVDLADTVASRLQAKVGLAAKPDASIQITRYRPVYVLGSVDKPGDYEYQPDLTVLEAVSLAGGLERVTGDTLLSYARDALTTRGDLRVLSESRLALLARQARLDAEINDTPAIALPADLVARQADPDVARVMREEQMLLDARRYAIQSQSATLEQTKSVLQQEVDSLAKKDATLANQLDTVRKELANITGLVSKGLTVLPRQLELEQTTAQFESNRIDVTVASLRAKQDMSKAERDILELKNTRRSEALQEATEVHNKLVETVEKIDTDQRLIAHVEVKAPAVLAAEGLAQQTPDYVINRRVDGAVRVIPVTENDAVQPGDVVRVIVKPTSSDPANLPARGDGRANLDAPSPSSRQGIASIQP